MKNILIALCFLISLGVLSLHAESFEGSEKSQAAAQARRHKPVEQCDVVTTSTAKPQRFVAMNFNAPLHIAGQKPATGTGSIMPAGLSGNPQIVAATSVLSHQPLVLNTEVANGPCCYEEGIQLLVAEESDHYVVSFDLASQQLGRSSSQFQLWLNDGPAPLLRLQSDYMMMLDGVGAIASFHDDQLLHVQLFLDLSTAQMTVAINGETLYQGTSTPLDHLHSLQFLMTIEGGATPEQVDPLASVAIDNIVVANAAYRYTNLQTHLQRGALRHQQKDQVETVAQVRNMSGHAAQQVRLTHLLPEGVRVIGMQSETLSCETSGDQVRCDTDALLPLEQASVTLTLALDDARSPLDISLIATSSTDEIDNYDNQTKARFAGSSTLLGIAFLLLLWMAREWYEER